MHPTPLSHSQTISVYLLPGRGNPTSSSPHALCPRSKGAVRCSRILGLQIKVKSGGHDYEGLSYVSAASAPFMVVDMINFREVTIDEKAKTARVQAAATLGELYYAISRTSRTLAFPAGTCPTVGVGGHFSGGG